MSIRLPLWLTALILTVAALYPTIYFHELAHSVSAYLLGCKADWWTTETSPFLYRSFGGPIDYTCLEAQGKRSLAIVDGAGVAMNILLLGVGTALARFSSFRPWKAFFLSFAAANFVEASSYLVVNTAILRSDMIAVVNFLGLNRVIIASGSLITAILVGVPLFRALSRMGEPEIAPRRIARLSIIIAVAVGGLMVMARNDLIAGSIPQ